VVAAATGGSGNRGVKNSEILPAQRKLLGEVARRISDRLEATFVPLPGGGDETRVGIELEEGHRKVVIELPLTLLLQAATDPIGREVLRTRIKARRDRMMFLVPPAALPKKIPPLVTVAPPRAGGYRGGRR
jgi:hypothetical protein